MTDAPGIAYVGPMCRSARLWSGS